MRTTYEFCTSAKFRAPTVHHFFNASISAYLTNSWTCFANGDSNPTTIPCFLRQKIESVSAKAIP